MSTSKNAKKRRQAQQAQRRRQAAASGSRGRTRTDGDEVLPAVLPPASTDPIEPSDPGPATPMGDPDDDADGPGFTPAKRGVANWVIAAVIIAMTVAALVLVFR